VNRIAVTRLTLTNFRCYAGLRLETDPRPVVLTGPNGAGKTNLLEALSYLTLGRGLRRAKLSEVARLAPGEDESTAARPWAVAAKLCREDGEVDVGTGTEAVQSDGEGGETRVVHIDGRPARGPVELGRLVGAHWLTPQMDRLFLDGSSERRRFIDRVALGVDPDHAGPMAAYDRALKGRSRLLRDGRHGPGADPAWLSALEDSMARHGVAVAAKRREMAARLRDQCRPGDGPFPGAGMEMSGVLEDWLDAGPAIDAEDRFRAALESSRGVDADSGGAAVGPHRSDLAVRHGDTGLAARQCSTGEQKALLVALVLAAARLHAAAQGHAPLLLLDEVVAHLDETRRHALFETVGAMGAQAWLTGTDAAVFAPLGDTVQHFTVTAAELRPA
jgi:DNA replication and repair protein RecF